MSIRKIKLSGREAAVIRSIDFTSHTPGQEIRDRTQMDVEDLVDVVNGLMDAGFVETHPSSESVALEAFVTTMFEVNPAYVHDLRAATRR
jgi:DNA-binding MarR family transcriptional regulator